MTLPWKRLIRFETSDGQILRGEPIVGEDVDVGLADGLAGLKARVLRGSNIFDRTGATKLTDEVVEVTRVLGPLAQSDVPIMRCIGLNYKTHSKNSVVLTTMQANNNSR
jgi:hypothetical protein